MTTNHKLDKIFGPAGSVAGIVLLIAGAVMIYQSYTAIVLIIAGAFVGFSSTGTLIDFELKRIKFSNNFFGY